MKLKKYHEIVGTLESYIQENDSGFVDTLYRRYKRTGRQLMERFGDAVPEAQSPSAQSTYLLPLSQSLSNPSSQISVSPGLIFALLSSQSLLPKQVWPPHWVPQRPTLVSSLIYLSPSLSVQHILSRHS